MKTLKENIVKIFARIVVYKTKKWGKKPLKTQNKIFNYLIQKGKTTSFGQDHDFKEIFNHKDFVKNVPVRDYEGLRPYFERAVQGEKNVLWPGKPLYFAKTSGTTSGVKYIPISKESMPTHVKGSRDAILHYINETGKAEFLNKKVIFLQGSPILEEINGIQTGRLSGIIAHHTPSYLKTNIMPRWETNCIEDWEEKVDEISKETIKEDMSVIGGIPPWVQMYFEKLKKLSGKKTIKKIFPNFNLFVYGGVNYEPYKQSFKKLIGKEIDSIEYYPASEGFFAYQDSQNKQGLLLLLNTGIYYEFIELDEMGKEDPKRLTIQEVELNTSYVLIVSTSAGLWGYNTGDTVSFVSLSPRRIIVTGRYKHFISAFGEHVIGSEVEKSLKESIEKSELIVKEFTVAPMIAPKEGLPFHEWWIEFENNPSQEEIKELEKRLDRKLQSLNAYYKDLIKGKVLKALEIVMVKKGGFNAYMKKEGKLGGQNKLPRLSNERKIVSKMSSATIKKTNQRW